MRVNKKQNRNDASYYLVRLQKYCQPKGLKFIKIPVPVLINYNFVLSTHF